MSESNSVTVSDVPRTRESLAEDLRALGIPAGSVLDVHSSLGSLGWVCGGAVAVVHALMDVLGPEGTLVMPTQTAHLSEPAHWIDPPVPVAWWPVIRASMPAFDPAVTPSRRMGAVVECFRTWPGTVRSAHPMVSFAARGPCAERVTAGHALADSLGEHSPLGRLYELDATVLLLGVGYERCTPMHLGEYRAPGRKRVAQASPVTERGARVWKHYDDIELDDSVFPAIGAALEATGVVRVGAVGGAGARWFPVRAAVDLTQRWLSG